MTFSDHRPRLLTCAAALGAALLIAPAAGAQEIGVMGAANPAMTGTAPSAPPRPLLTGEAVFSDDDIVSGPDGLGFAMFHDQTTLTIAPNSRIRLDKYVYDPASERGEIGVSLLRGAVRMIGGRVTKTADATIRTPTATIGIRGGAATVESFDDGGARVTLIGGEYAHVATATDELYISRPGGSAVVDPNGDVSYAGVIDTMTAEQVTGLFITPGDGGAPAERLPASAGGLATDNSLAPGAVVAEAVATNGLFLETTSVLDDAFDLSRVEEVAQAAVYSDMDRLGALVDNADFVDIGGTGVIQGQLIWTNTSDLDLHLILPNNAGEVAWFNKTVIFNDNLATATLDVDNLGGVVSVAPNKRVENIVVNGDDIPKGTYVFFVDAFTVRGEGKTSYSLNVTGDGGGTIRRLTGALGPGEDSPNVQVIR
ncbi:FecR family protein [Pikeienuella sp. HZG-20]|uniref:FecR family protein n=1 Tax=Paludibacillus litoralis TaxID=3133267 RepID=UPI0030ED407E